MCTHAIICFHRSYCYVSAKVDVCILKHLSGCGLLCVQSLQFNEALYQRFLGRVKERGYTPEYKISFIIVSGVDDQNKESTGMYIFCLCHVFYTIILFPPLMLLKFVPPLFYLMQRSDCMIGPVSYQRNIIAAEPIHEKHKRYLNLQPGTPTSTTISTNPHTHMQVMLYTWCHWWVQLQCKLQYHCFHSG